MGEVLDRDSLKVIDPSPDRMVEPSGNSFINLNEVILILYLVIYKLIEISFSKKHLGKKFRLRRT